MDADPNLALPHDEVDSSEFYKHIEANGLSEPRRMRQLLTWCGTRALGEKPSFSSADSHARLAGMLSSPGDEDVEVIVNSTRDTATAPQRLFVQVRTVGLV